MTRMLRRGGALLVVAVLAGVPALGGVCMALCAPDAGAAAHAGHPAHCDEAAPVEAASIGWVAGGSSVHDCGRHEAAHIISLMASPSGRADTGVLTAAAADSAAVVSGSQATSRRAPAFQLPVSPPAPPGAPLALRI